MKPININTFAGMHNIKAAEGKVNEPRIILNADVTDDGRVVKRAGITEFLALAGAHSLWAGTQAMLCMAAGKLYRVNDATATELATVSGSDSPASYIEIDGLVYISNKYWTGIFDHTDNSVSSWGQLVPNAPVCTSSSSGALPAGSYHVAYTHIDSDNRLSGNSQITEIILTDTGGITLTGKTVTDIVWCTDPDGFEMYKAGDINFISDKPSTIEPLPTLWCYPPLKFENLCHAFGRMWGSKGDKVYYSEPFRPDLWRLYTGFFKFDQNVNMIANVPTGIFVGCENATFFLGGTEPNKMQQVSAGAGSIQGTMKYCNNVRAMGDVISPSEKVHVDVPVWVSKEGIVAGNASGKLFNLTQKKVQLSGASKGAALTRQKDGSFQYLASFKQGPLGSAAGFADSATVEVIRNGKVI